MARPATTPITTPATETRVRRTDLIPVVAPEVLGAAIREILGELGYEAKKVILFGSRARGDWGPDSDYDLLVEVVEPDPTTRVRLMCKVHLGIVKLFSIPIDLLFYDTKQLVKRMRGGHSVLEGVLKEGLYV